MDHWRGLGYSLASYWDELMFIQNGTGAVMEVGSFRQAVISFFPSCEEEEEEEEACCCLLVTGNVLAWPVLSCAVLSCYYNYQKDDGLVNCSSNIILILFVSFCFITSYCTWLCSLQTNPSSSSISISHHSFLPSPNKSHACHNYLLLLHLPNYINSNDNKFFMSFQTNGGGYGDALYSDANGMIIS
jgi:hypothetical protein